MFSIFGALRVTKAFKIRESETTIKIKFALFRGGGWAGRQRGKLSKTLVLARENYLPPPRSPNFG